MDLVPNEVFEELRSGCILSRLTERHFCMSLVYDEDAFDMFSFGFESPVRVVLVLEFFVFLDSGLCR